MFLLKPHRLTLVQTLVAACVALGVSASPAPLSAQDTTGTPSAASRMATRLRVVFRPPPRGTRRERMLTRGDGGARALVPDARIDSLVAQTMREAPFVAVCATGQPDSARLTVRLVDSAGVASGSGGAMVPLVAGLNRIPLAASGIMLPDGGVAEWTLATRSGEVFLTERIERRMVRSTPTINALARNGIWYDALDLFVVDALRGLPLAAERFDAFLQPVGTASCPVPAVP